MTRHVILPLAAAALSICLACPAYAEWVQDVKGWRFRGEDGQWLTNTVTPDGARVGQFGYWEGNDVFSGLDIKGSRILKSQGNAVLDQEENVYRVRVDVYDTVFFTSEEIQKIKKDDVIEIPGLGIRATAVTRASKSTVRANASEEDGPGKSIEEQKSLYRVRLVDEEGQNYILTSLRLRRTSADSSTTETLLRPVAEGIEILVPAKEKSKKASGASSYTSTPVLLKAGKLFTAVLRGNLVLEIKDTTYNYDTTTTPEFTEDQVHNSPARRKETENPGPDGLVEAPEREEDQGPGI